MVGPRRNKGRRRLERCLAQDLLRAHYGYRILDEAEGVSLKVGAG